jgi:serine phosphatase RsbU (regulator of sigma subunit)
MAFANQAAIAIENANLRRLEHEIADAREMQMSLLPKSAPQIEGFDIAGVCEPAAEVGGDYFTYLWLDEQKTQLGIVLMDVTGHGMKAATTTFLANGMLQSEIKSGKPPGRIMADMHQSLQEILSKNAFVAMSFALIDTRQKILTHFNAGLSKPILIRNGEFAELDIQSNVPLGCRFPADYVGTSVPLFSGDVLLLHSDGLTEAEDANEQMYEYTRMDSLLDSLASRTQSAQEWLDAILTDVMAFTEPEPDDDLTVVVVRVL